MARGRPVAGEKALFRVTWAKSDLVRFAEAVMDETGVALGVARSGGRHPRAKPWKGPEFLRLCRTVGATPIGRSIR